MEELFPHISASLGALLLGVGAGVVHVISGPDHVATVVPLVANGRRRAWVIGFLWGTGHTSGFWLVGVLALALSDWVNWQRLGIWGDSLGGVALVGLGVWGLLRSVGPYARALGRRSALAEHSRTHLACLLGSLHGLAGSSHYLGVLPALIFSSHVAGVCYLAGFGIGTIVTMVLVAWWWGQSCAWAGGRGAHWEGYLRAGSSLFALFIGVYWVVA